MQVSEQGLKLLIQLEGGARLKAYKAHPNEKYLTIGIGHYGKDVTQDMTITNEQAIELFKKDISKREETLNSYIKTQVSQNQFDALFIFMYNVGETALKNSTLLRYVNVGKFESASNEFEKWNKVSGVVVRGLTNRQRITKRVFVNGIYEV